MTDVDVAAGGGVDTSSAPVDAGAAEASEAFSLPVEFDTMGDLDGVTIPSQPAPQTPSAPPQTQQTEAPKQAPQAPQAQPGKPQPQPAQPAQPAQPPSAAPASPSSRTPVELLGELNKARDSLVSTLATGRFKVDLSKDEVAALETDAIAALPQVLSRLGAQLYFEAATTTINQIANMVPRMIEQYMADNAQSNSAVDAFSAAWPQIDMKNPQVQDVVHRVATTFRQMNPTVSREDAIKFVGGFVCQQLGLPFQAAAGNGRTAGARPRAPSFAPAGGVGHGAAQRTQSQAADPFGGMGMQFDE